MADLVDLELSLRRAAGDEYALAMQLSQPGGDAEARLGPAHDAAVHFDLPALGAAAGNPAAYGKLLSQSLFAEAEVLAGFQQARAAARVSGEPLRLRLVIAPEAAALHSLFWETLRDPEDPEATLFTGEQILFSRYLSSRDLDPVKLRPREALRALAAAANPSDLLEYGLHPLSVDDELARARKGLGSIPVTPLPAEESEHCTLDLLMERLRAGCDILYLAAHGIFQKGGPWLMLEGADGKVERVSGRELVEQMRGMGAKPRLIVLASCESAGKGTGEALQALGPALAEAGVPAVLAMQGSIGMGTVARFMPVFFAELQKDGCIDRAVSVARAAVRREADFWMPALFMRLKSGRIWAEEPQEAPVTIRMTGDIYNVSDIHNSNVTLGSTVIHGSPAVLPGLDDSAREELKQLLGKLDLALGKASGPNTEAAGAVAALVKALVEELVKEKPGRARVRVLLGGLEQAAALAGKGLPDVPALTSRISSMVSEALSLTL